MKNLIEFQGGLVLIIIFFLSITSYSANPDKPTKETANTYNDYTILSDETLMKVQTNLMKGLNSDNLGLEVSCAYFIGELGCCKARVHLMKLARSGETEELRIIAGLSLYKIHSDIGMYQLKGMAQTDKSSRVRKIFDRIYQKYAYNKYTFIDG